MKFTILLLLGIFTVGFVNSTAIGVGSPTPAPSVTTSPTTPAPTTAPTTGSPTTAPTTGSPTTAPTTPAPTAAPTAAPAECEEGLTEINIDFKGILAGSGGEDCDCGEIQQCDQCTHGVFGYPCVADHCSLCKYGGGNASPPGSELFPCAPPVCGAPSNCETGINCSPCEPTLEITKFSAFLITNPTNVPRGLQLFGETTFISKQWPGTEPNFIYSGAWGSTKGLRLVRFWALKNCPAGIDCDASGQQNVVINDANGNRVPNPALFPFGDSPDGVDKDWFQVYNNNANSQPGIVWGSDASTQPLLLNELASESSYISSIPADVEAVPVAMIMELATIRDEISDPLLDAVWGPTRVDCDAIAAANSDPTATDKYGFNCAPDLANGGFLDTHLYFMFKNVEPPLGELSQSPEEFNFIITADGQKITTTTTKKRNVRTNQSSGGPLSGTTE